MDQVDVCNSWEEFDDNSKLLEQQLEKLKIQKGSLRSGAEKQSTTLQSSTSSVPEEIPKMRILKRTDPVIKTEVTNKGTSAASTNGVDDSNGVVIQDESLRTQYVPPEPRISILSRPKKKTSDEASSSNSSQSKNKNQPPKTLEQREQEYAEARRRIFGDAEGGDTTTVETT